MSTNFYFVDREREAIRKKLESVLSADELKHVEIAGHKSETFIGKRSAAGLYCWDCNATLCASGKDGVHRGYSHFFSKCSACGGEPRKESIDEGSVGLELGFSKINEARPKGVSSCSSFHWHLKREDVQNKCNKELLNEIIVDEYGKKMTGEVFMCMLLCQCPIQFMDLIGDDNWT